MAQIVLLHSALGLNDGVREWADALRDEGYDVITPDLFGGRTFDDIDAGVELIDGSGGPPAFVDEAVAQMTGLDGPRVYAGFSFGGAVAEVLALTRDDAAGLVVMHGAMSPAWIDVTMWPSGLRAQLHYMRDDPWSEDQENASFMALADKNAREFVYEGDGHLFAFQGWKEYDGDAADLMFERVTDFLAEIDNGE
jgi:dienelactone hydrolase